jgi:hypothetical protein
MRSSYLKASSLSYHLKSQLHQAVGYTEHPEKIQRMCRENLDLMNGSEEILISLQCPSLFRKSPYLTEHPSISGETKKFPNHS